MNTDKITKEELISVIDSNGPVTFIDHTGSESESIEVFEQLSEGWRVGFLARPVSNVITEFYVVATANHKDHYGFDAGDCVELVAKYKGADALEFWDDFVESGGRIYEVEQ